MVYALEYFGVSGGLVGVMMVVKHLPFSAGYP